MICLIVTINLSKPRKATKNALNQLLFEAKLRNFDTLIFSDPKYYQILGLIRMRHQIYTYISGTYNDLKSRGTLYNYITKTTQLFNEEV
jgi:hypothetical protein